MYKKQEVIVPETALTFGGCIREPREIFQILHFHLSLFFASKKAKKYIRKDYTVKKIKGSKKKTIHKIFGVEM